jgi:CheY-like chemotaxis protein
MMPEMDGWSVLTQLKGDPLTRMIPVIMATIVDDRELGYTLGAHEFMLKPIDREHLVSVLRKLERSSQTLLVVEDDPAARDLLERTLTAEGWTLIEAENGRVALGLLEQHQPDAVILDLMMPEMDGFEFLEVVRADPRWRNLPVIVVTARELSDAERAFLSGNVQQILLKGATSKDELLRRLCQALEAVALEVSEPRT